MKSFYISGLVAILMFFSVTASGQLRKVPAEVTNAFSEKYSNAKNVEWKDKLSGFTATFTLDGTEYLASFSNKAEWEYTEEAIDEEDLPDVVKEGFDKSKYADWDIILVNRIELPKEEIQFKLGIGKGDIKKRNLYYSNEGRLLKDKLTL